MTLSRTDAIELLVKYPYKFGHLLGFKKLTPLHNEWIKQMVFGEGDETLQAHRGSYKTTCVSIALAIICILFPNDRSLFLRKTDGDIKEIMKQVQKILSMPCTKYLVSCIYGCNIVLVSSTQNEVMTNLTTDIRGTAQIVGLGLGSSLTGKHFDRIFTDDIVNVNDRMSKAERDRTKQMYQELHNLKNRGGRIVNTGTPWHADDAFTLMPNPKKYDCYHTNLISEEELADIRKKMTASLFAANYELRHVAAEDVIFENPQTGADPFNVEQGELHIDAAYGGEDYTAMTIIRKIGNKYFVFGKLWSKHVDSVLDEIIGYRKQFNAGKIFCEDNGDKGYLAKELRRRGERAVTYHEDMNKFLKITSYLKFAWEDVVFVSGTDQEYIRQICDYTEEAEHDDAPDSLASMIRRLWKRKSGEDRNVDGNLVFL